MKEKALRRKTGLIPAMVIYAFLWMFFLIIPVITNNYADEGRFARIYFDWLRMSPFFIVFLVNSLILLPMVLFRGSTKTYLVLLLITALGIAWAFESVRTEIFRNDPELLEQRLLQDPQYGREEMSPGIPSNEIPGNTQIFKAPSQDAVTRPASPYQSAFQFLNTFLISLLIAGFNTAIAMTNRWIKEEQARRDAEKEHIKSELAFLQNQVSPHFFMNTLNNIHALIGANSDLARDSVLKLSALMRYLLYESGRGTTTLRKEAEFIRSYVNLMQLRFDKNVTINLDLPSNLNDINLPPLLFVSFIENAFKHGISSREPSTISFRLRQSDDSLEFTSINTIPAHRNATTPVSYNGGIGLENIRKRLDLLFKDKYKLDIFKTENEFRVHLVLQFWPDS